MARAPVDRYDTAARFGTSLGEIEIVGRPAAPDKSLAVMPFVNRSGDADNRYFSDGLSEDLINALTALPGLQVASRTSAFRFRGSELDIRDIGEQLNVACVLEGSVRRAGSKLRVTAQLVSVGSGYQLWSERYDREMADVFEIQDEIVGAIVKALVPALMGEAAAPVRRSTENLEAYELYLKGRHYWHQRTPAAVRVAIQCFEQAITLDAEYALAYAGLADSYGILRVYGWMSADEANPRALDAVARAMAIDPSLAESNFSNAFAIFYCERKWREAGPHYARALEINPRSSLSQGYSGCFAAMEQRGDDARRFMARSIELDPLSPFTHGLSAAAYYTLGDFEAARQAALRSLELQPDFMLGLWVGGLALSGLGRHDEGLILLERAMVLSRAPTFVCTLGLGLARAGRTEDAKRLLGELEERASRGEYVPAFAPLAIHVGLGDLPAIRRGLAASLEEITPTFSLRVTGGVFLDAYADDPEIDRLYSQLYQDSTMWRGR
jgi:serine/threonine-protein kinase